MARISGVELADNLKVDYALTRLKGIGWEKSRSVLKDAGISGALRLRDLTPDDVAALSAALEKHPVEGDLVRMVRSNIQRLKDIGTYRGVRHNRGLPSRGQRTKSNARTKRGKRKTVGAFKKEMLAKVESAKKTK